jgi:putative transposase
VKYAWIKQHCDSFSVIAMCCVLKVSKSGFYKWLKAVPSSRARRSERIRTTVREIHKQSHQIYGSYKIAEVMQANDELETACRNTVAAAMREIDLKSRMSGKFTPTTTVVDPTKRPAANVLNQVFSADAPNRKWVTDITYLPTQSGWLVDGRQPGDNTGEFRLEERGRISAARDPAVTAPQRSRLPVHQ